MNTTFDNPMIMQTPNWSYGKKRDFGPLFKSERNNKIIVKFNKGVFFLRGVDFNYKMEKDSEDDTGEDNEDGSSEEKESEKLYFKTAISPSIVVTEPCGACLSYSDFPLYIFASVDGDVIFTTEKMESFRKFSKTTINKIDSSDSSLSANSYSVNTVDEELYTATDDVPLSKTAIALLIPIMCIEASKRKNDSIIIDSVMDIRPYDSYKFTENEDMEEPNTDDDKKKDDDDPNPDITEQEDPCEDADKNGGNNGAKDSGDGSKDGDENNPGGEGGGDGGEGGVIDCGGKDGTGENSSEEKTITGNSGEGMSTSEASGASSETSQNEAKQRAINENSSGEHGSVIASLIESIYVKE